MTDDSSAQSSLWGRLVGDSKTLSNAPLRRRQQLFGAAAAAGIVGLGCAAFWTTPETPRSSAREAELNDLTLHPERAQRESYVLQTESRMDELDLRLSRMEKTTAGLRTDLAALTAELKSQNAVFTAIERDRKVLMDWRDAEIKRSEKRDMNAPDSMPPGDDYDPTLLDSRISEARARRGPPPGLLLRLPADSRLRSWMPRRTIAGLPSPNISPNRSSNLTNRLQSTDPRAKALKHGSLPVRLPKSRSLPAFMPQREAPRVLSQCLC